MSTKKRGYNGIKSSHRTDCRREIDGVGESNPGALRKVIRVLTSRVGWVRGKRIKQELLSLC
eukprot:scaffold4013_cov16-Prasinocladus_malaysianus.AAC.1